MPWDLPGNSGTDPNINFLGTTDNQPLNIKTNGAQRMQITAEGDLHIEGRLSMYKGTLVIFPQDDADEGGEIALFAADSDQQVRIDNFGGAFRVITVGRERLRVTSDGSVGIGTGEPDAGLEINKEATNDLALLLNSSGLGWGSGIQFRNTAAGGKTYGIYSGWGKLHFADVDNSVDRLIIDQVGNVGVDMPEPKAKLDVAGDVRANDVILNSDGRLKIDIAPVPDALGKLQKIRGVAFARLEPEEPSGCFTKRNRIGVIAQDVESVFPELVDSPSDGGYKGVNYAGLTGVLIEASKELKEENDALKRRIEALERAMAGGS